VSPVHEGGPQELPTVFMFSGQGSQYYGMGAELFEANAVFRTALRRYDAVVADESGESVLERILDPAKPKNHPLVDTRIAHPGIVMVELALAETLRAEGIEPDYVLGSSLGEYAAAVVAGALDSGDCLRVLVRQAEILRGSPPGGMLAVLDGLEVLERVPELGGCEIAARNYPGNFLVAGAEEDLARAEAGLRERGVLHLRLPVEYGYHSRLMDGVLERCRGGFEGVELAPPRLPWVSCVDGELVRQPGEEHFRRVARRPIEFERAMAGLRERGDFLCLDLGPSGSLHNFVRNLLPDGARSRSLPLLSQFAPDTELFDEVRRQAARGTPRKAHGMKVYGFPGQGSQRRGMGRELFARFPEETAAADRVLGYSVEELCLTDPERRLVRTEFTQPALYVVGALSYLDRAARDPEPPDWLVGHSLGEYVALFAAGTYDFETGLRLVQRRGELLARAEGGTMAAVVGVDEDTVTRTLADPALDGLDLANHNALDQFVVSGPRDLIDAACAAFESAGARTVRLNVSAPLHSRYMRGAAEEFARFLDGFELNPPAIPVLANVDAAPYTDGTVKERLTEQIASPVRWTDTVRRLMAEGDFEFHELGPGRVLSKLVDRIRSAAGPLPAPPEPGPVPVTGPVPEPVPAPAAEVPSAAGESTPWESTLRAEELGARGFRERYGLRLAYAVGSMYGGVSGRELLRSTAKAGLLGFLGTGGLGPGEVERQLRGLRDELGDAAPVGANLLHRHGAPEDEAALVDLLLRHGVGLVEASGFPSVTEPLVRFRLKGGRILAKVPRTDVAAEFLAPPPQPLVSRLLAAGAVTQEEAAAAAGRPLADDLCVEADGGWLRGTSDLMTLLPAVLRLRDAAAVPGHPVHVGCAGGLGTPEAVAAAFLMGADFVLTGSVNQCSVEAGTSDAVKELLQQAREFDVATAPWGELFELGVQARYLSRGLLFPARAARLHELWRGHTELSELDGAVRSRLLDDPPGGHPGGEPAPSRSPAPSGTATGTASTAADADPKAELTAALRGYFDRGFRLATSGDQRHRADYLVYCGPSMGAFNQLVAGTGLHPWRARTVEAVAATLMEGAAAHIVRTVARAGRPRPAGARAAEIGDR